MKPHTPIAFVAVVLPCLIAFSFTGCATTSLNQQPEMIAASDIPRELQKVSHPTYRVAPPDLLLIEAVHNIRPANDPLRVGDVLFVRLGNPVPLKAAAPGATDMEQQLWLSNEAEKKFVNREFRIQPDGTLDLGAEYGNVPVEGLTLAQARVAIRKHFTAYGKDAEGKPYGIKDPQVSVTMPNLAGKQVIAGDHLVRQDGTVSLGVFGSVHVAGKSLREVKLAVERHLSQSINKPEVSVDVGSYNSQVYYVIMDGGGYGETVIRLPCTGNETVLDAIANVGGLSQISSKKIWVARPSPAGATTAQVLDVDYSAITKEGLTATNYQLLPGDRIYIAADHMIAFGNFLEKTLAPFERILGFTLLGHGAVRSLQNGHRQGSAGGGGGGFGF